MAIGGLGIRLFTVTQKVLRAVDLRLARDSEKDRRQSKFPAGSSVAVWCSPSQIYDPSKRTLQSPLTVRGLETQPRVGCQVPDRSPAAQQALDAADG
jgi:hypothetical protein